MTNKQREYMYQRIRQHGERLLELFPNAITTDPVKLCKKLFSLENRMHKVAEDLCNGIVDDDQYEAICLDIRDKTGKILGTGADTSYLYINGDPRGHALKFQHWFTRDTAGQDIYRDMGGYGIVAPDYKYEAQRRA